MNRTGAKALRDRLLSMPNSQIEEFWVRIQKARCRAGATHYRRLIEPDTDQVTVDLGPCAHFPEQ